MVQLLTLGVSRGIRSVTMSELTKEIRTGVCDVDPVVGCMLLY